MTRTAQVQRGASYRNWTVLRDYAPDRHGQPRYWCRCKCGRERDVTRYTLINTRSASCAKCRPTAPWTPSRLRAMRAAAGARYARKNGLLRPFYRCKALLLESTERYPIECGAVVWEEEMGTHLAEMHGLTGGDWFERVPDGHGEDR